MSSIDFESLNFQNGAINKILATVRIVAEGLGTVLISGGSGVGKTALAHFIHRKSQRADLTIVDCKATNSLVSIKGGTLLLENIDQATESLQQEVLNYLNRNEEGSRARVIATSRRDLRQAVKTEEFRQDLFYKLAVIHLELPELKSRLEDLAEISQFLLDVYGIIHGKSSLKLATESLEKLQAWQWTGNIRELENVIERAVILTEDSVIKAESICLETPQSDVVLEFSPGMSLSEVEKRLILQTLELTAHNRTRAASLLGISIRTLRNKLNEYREGGIL